MAGFTLKDSVNFDDWQFFQSEDLRLELAGTLERLIKCHSLRQEFEPAIRYARRWLDLDPLHESAHGILMQAGVVIVEALDLREAPAGPYLLACLPLRIEDVEAAPARVVLIDLEGAPDDD